MRKLGQALAFHRDEARDGGLRNPAANPADRNGNKGMGTTKEKNKKLDGVVLLPQVTCFGLICQSQSWPDAPLSNASRKIPTGSISLPYHRVVCGATCRSRIPPSRGAHVCPRRACGRAGDGDTRDDQCLWLSDSNLAARNSNTLDCSLVVRYGRGSSSSGYPRYVALRWLWRTTSPAEVADPAMP